MRVGAAGRNFRLMKRMIRGVTQYNWFAVVAVYYNEGGTIVDWDDNVGANGETVEDARNNYDLMAGAFSLPILDEWALLGKREGRNGKATE